MSNDMDSIIMKYKEVLGTEDKFYEDSVAVQNILPYLLLLQNNKEKCYGESWRKYEDIGAFLNLARKYDRIENIMKRAMLEGTQVLWDGSSDLSTETILDTIADLALYSLMWTSYIATRYPQLWERFLTMNGLVKPATEQATE